MKTYNVTFVSDYMVIVITVYANDEDGAEKQASEVFIDEHGIDRLRRVSSMEVELQNDDHDPVTSKPLIATCGHEDSLGYFTNLPCGKCVRKAHKKAVGR